MKGAIAASQNDRKLAAIYQKLRQTIPYNIVIVINRNISFLSLCIQYDRSSGINSK